VPRLSRFVGWRGEPREDIDNGRVMWEIGVVRVKPAKFVTFRYAALRHHS